MKVGINGIFWAQERTGSGQYTQHLWQELHKLDAPALQTNQDTFQLLGYNAPELGLNSVAATQTSLAALPNFLNRTGKNSRKIWWEQSGLPLLVKNAATMGQPFDVVHYPYFAAPLRKLPGQTKLVVTVHDLIPLLLPEYADSLPLKLYFRLAAAAVRRADLILADSEFSKRDVLRLLKVPAEKVQVVYLAVDSDKYQAKALPTEERRELLRKFGMDGEERLIFYIGGFDRRKNVGQLLEAFQQALPRLRELEQADTAPRWVLALAGKPHSANTQMFPDLSAVTAAINGQEAGRVRFLGPISETDKAQLYRAADLFVFPSRYEGFGLDPLEALASATPVLCSNSSSLPEVVGDAAYLVSPDNVEIWRDALLKLVATPALRQQLANAGPTQAAKFSWQATATRTLELYNMLECFITRGEAR